MIISEIEIRESYYNLLIPLLVAFLTCLGSDAVHQRPTAFIIQVLERGRQLTNLQFQAWI